MFAIVSLALFMSSVDATIVATALPTLRRALHAPLNWASWTITAYELGLVVAMPVAGRISDQLGRRRVFLVSAVVFTTSSLLCGLAGNVDELVGLRILQALGGGAFMPSATGIVADAFGRRRERAIGLFSSVFPLGALVGPVIGGVVISDWSWRGIFLVNVPIGVVFTLLALRYLPRSRATGGHTDVAGALALGACILGLMLAITRLGSRGATPASVGFLLPLAAAGASGAWFLWRAGRVDDPLIPVRLLRGRAFVLMNAVNFVWGACVIGLGALVPLVAEERYHLAPIEAGTLLTARAVGEILLAITSAFLLRRTGYRVPMIVGFGLIAGGFLLVALHPLALGPYGWLALAAGITGLGTGASAPASNNAMLHLLPDDVGAISGLRGAARQAGAIVGVAVTTSVVARSRHESVALSHAYIAFALLLVAMVPVVLVAVPRRGRGSHPVAVAATGQVAAGRPPATSHGL